jgi:hypothetical protein
VPALRRRHCPGNASNTQEDAHKTPAAPKSPGHGQQHNPGTHTQQVTRSIISRSTSPPAPRRVAFLRAPICPRDLALPHASTEHLTSTYVATHIHGPHLFRRMRHDGAASPGTVDTVRTAGDDRWHRRRSTGIGVLRRRGMNVHPRDTTRLVCRAETARRVHAFGGTREVWPGARLWPRRPRVPARTDQGEGDAVAKEVFVHPDGDDAAVGTFADRGVHQLKGVPDR